MNRSLRIVYLENTTYGAVIAKQALDKGNLSTEINVAGTRQQFIEALTDFSPDLILSEYALPDIHCSQALDLLKQNKIDIPFIIVTNAICDEIAEELLLMGVDDYITKDNAGRLPFAVLRCLEKYEIKREQQQLLQQLTNSEKWFRTLVENSTDAVVVLDPEGRPTYASPTVKSVLGYSPDEVIGIDMSTLIHPEEAGELSKIMMKILACPGVTIQGHTGRMLHKDGSWRWIEATITNLLHEPGINGIIDNFRDVTGKRNADEQLKYKQWRLSQAQAIAHLGSWELDLSTDISIWSEEACRICGLSEKDTVQSSASLLSFVHPEDLENVIKINKDALYSAQAADYYHRIIRKDQQIRHLHVQTQLELNNKGKPVRLYGIMHDVTEMENSQQALRNSESNLRAIFENTSEGFILTDNQAIIRYFNGKSRYFYELSTGKKIKIGSSLLEVISEPKRTDFETAITKVLSGDVWQYEHAYQHRNGEKQWFNITVNPVYENHLVTGLSLAIMDITDRRLAQDLLQRSEANLNAIMDNTDALIYSLDTEFKYITCNHAHKSMMKKKYGIDVQPGYDIRESISRFDPGSVQEWKQINRRVLNGEVLKFEKEVPFHGIISHFKYAIHPIRKNDTVTGLACFVIDITREKQADEKAFKALEEKYVILESIGDGFYALDKNWIVTYWNKKAGTLLNCPKETILGQSLWNVFSDVVDTELYHAYHSAVKQNTILHFELYYKRDNSWFEITAYPSTSGLSVYFRDITKRKESESRLNELNQNLRDFTNELIKSNKGLEQFSYIVSHNLRAPVANIIGLAGLITHEGYTDQVKEELLYGILVNVKRLDDVITDLNTILQVKREVSEKREPVNLQQLVDDIRLSIQETIEKEQVKILTDFSAAPELFTLRSYLHSIFYNLIINSIKFRQPDLTPVIQIKSNLDQGQVSVSFLDNGMGIDLLKKGDQLFGLYKRFHHHVEGKGMGLFMAKTQAEKLGGRIAVNSTVNKGTEFKIEFLSDQHQNFEI